MSAVTGPQPHRAAHQRGISAGRLPVRLTHGVLEPDAGVGAAAHGIFVFTASVLALVPGPSVLFVVSRSLALGRTAGLATAVGDNLGKIVQVVVVAFGAGIILEQSIVVFNIVKLVGAAYLVYLGVQAIRHRRSLHDTLEGSVEPRQTRRILGDALVVGASNPKGVVIISAVLPQFIDRAAGHLPLQLLTLGAIFVVVTLAANLIWALGASSARSWFARSPRRLEAVGGAGGLTMIGIGVSLAIAGRND
jgi:threonine/homoserine/homoserine lactone efflux protein